MPLPSDPESVVQRQLDAFNARDLEALIALVMIYEVQKGRIARAWSITGEKTLDPKPC